LVWRYVTE